MEYSSEEVLAELLSLRKIVDKAGDTIYRNRENQVHRIYGPAFIERNGTCHWLKNGKRHREDGPAIVYSDSGREWYINGKRHREDGPAIIYPGGNEWFIDGERHREDGPAIVTDRFQSWFAHGVRHRKDGPAVIWANGTKEWYINGELIRREFGGTSNTS